MTTADPNVKDIFGKALDLQSPAERAEFLDNACASNPVLRAEVEDLLSAVASAGSFMKGPVYGVEPTLAQPARLEQPGQMIRPYKLRERLGEGGMGVVWAAEQKQPLRRKVAIKVIKPGMDSSHVIARFEAEREALSLMDHPNIARVLDAGTTEQGRPYFVMELIHGVPITEYCDAQKLTIRDRIGLFIQVCKAVQHAHQKGIIHRDIKPSNVLVTEQDGEPVPKVIDFGIAKALHRSLTDRSIYTGVFQAIGTLAYMSPEQATLSQHDVDTRADVYGLGILLYELLTGTTPLDRDKLEQGALDEALRMIREQDPLKPSTKVSSLGNKTQFISQLRCTDARSLSKSIRGDLDWIVMKALEKDRKWRYETASLLGDELIRFLDNKPVEACPPSAIYRTRKFVQRNRGFAAAAAAVSVVLLGGIVGTSGVSVWALNEKVHAEQQAIRANALATELKVQKEEITSKSLVLLEAVKREAAAAALAGDYKTARASLELLRQLSATEYEYERNVIEGLIAFNSEQYEKANQYAKLALSEELGRKPAEQIAAQSLHALARRHLGDSEGYGQGCRQLRDLKPKTDTDHLLMALALMLFDPRQSDILLQATPKASNTAAGLLIRGIVHTLIGCDDQDTSKIDAAIRDIDCSRLLTEREGVGLGQQLYSISVAFEIARSRGDAQNAARYLLAGRSLVEESASDNPSTYVSRYFFYRADGEPERAARAIRQIGRFPTYSVMFLAADCLQRLDDPAARNEFDEAVAPELRQSEPVRMARIHLLSGRDADSEETEELVAKLLEKDSSLEGLFALYALCRIAEPEEIHERAKQFASRMRHISYSDNELFGNLANIDVLAGGKEEECLETAGDSALAMSQAHFTIGMLRLAYADNIGAYEHFKRSVETNAVGTYGYEWARAYKERMEKDRTWPSRRRD